MNARHATLTDLVTRVRTGDQQAWDALVERYAPLVWAICRRYRLSAADAQDAGQSVWLHLVEHLNGLRDPAALPGWLATTTRRECARVLRAAHHRHAAVLVPDAGDIADEQAEIPDQELLAAERHATLRQALTCLPPRGQQLLTLLTYDPPMPYAQISATLGIPVGSIGPLRSRYLHKLRSHSAITALINADAASAADQPTHTARQLTTAGGSNTPTRREAPTMIHRVTRLLLATAATAATIAAAVLAVLGAAPAQAASANLFASVSASGTLVTGNGVSSVTHIGTGQYEVTFTASVAGCAYEATTIASGSQALLVFTAGGHLSADGVYVETKNQGGGLTDGPFNLAVDCGAPGWSFAVVGYTANLVRATAGTTLTHLGPGRYDVTFSSSVKKCAYLATVGDPGNSLVFNPNGVYTGSGPNADTVYLETKNLGGGLADGIPFHLAVICPTAANTEIAVVNANGIPARASALTSSFTSSTGEYTLATGRALSACAAIATRGSVNTSVPFDPATAEITPGPAANTTGIQVRGLLSGGGNLAAESFHAATIC